MATFEVDRSDGTTITVDADDAEQATRRGKDGGYHVTDVREISVGEGDDGGGDSGANTAGESEPREQSFIPATDEQQEGTEESGDATNPG